MGRYSELARLLDRIHKDALRGGGLIEKSEDFTYVHEDRAAAATRETTFALARRILRAWDWEGFVLAIIRGGQGNGKSVYAIKVSYQVLKHLDLLSKGYYTVIDHYLVFEFGEFLDKVAVSSWESRLPVLIWDDAGVHASKYRYTESIEIPDPTSRTGKRKVRFNAVLQGLFDTIRSRIAGVLLTTPNPQNLAKSLRDYDAVIVDVVRHNRLWASANGYIVRQTPTGQLYAKKIFVDGYYVYLPDPVYEYYKRKRDRYVTSAIAPLLGVSDVEVELVGGGSSG